VSNTFLKFPPYFSASLSLSLLLKLVSLFSILIQESYCLVVGDLMLGDG
jgi:hypothetical protein